jgi:hypothetical protein
VSEWTDLDPIYVHFFAEGTPRITNDPTNYRSTSDYVSRIKVAPILGLFDD